MLLKDADPYEDMKKFWGSPDLRLMENLQTSVRELLRMLLTQLD